MPIGSRRTIEVKPGRYSPATWPGMRAHRAGEEAVAVDDRRDLVVEHGVDRLAAVQRFERGELLGLGLDAVGDLQEIAGALRRRRARPGGEGLLGGGDRRLDLRLAGLRQVEDGLAGLAD